LVAERLTNDARQFLQGNRLRAAEALSVIATEPRRRPALGCERNCNGAVRASRN